MSAQGAPEAGVARTGGRGGSTMTRWSVYVVRCRDGALYTGIATDVRRRLAEHAQRSGRGAKFLRGRGPLHLVFQRAIGSRGVALRVEGAIKKLPKARKEALIVDLARAARPRRGGVRRSNREGQLREFLKSLSGTS